MNLPLVLSLWSHKGKEHKSGFPRFLISLDFPILTQLDSRVRGNEGEGAGMREEGAGMNGNEEGKTQG